jgi:farnesyl diphosphate synthase
MPITRPQFEEVFPQLIQDLTNHCCNYGLPEQALIWFRNVSTIHTVLALRLAELIAPST